MRILIVKKEKQVKNDETHGNGKIYGFIGWDHNRVQSVMRLKDLQTGEETDVPFTFETRARFTDSEVYREEQINKLINE